MKPDPPAAPHPKGNAKLFTSTHWSVVLRAKDKSEAALNSLCAAYRSPLLVWLRARGTRAEDAEDLVQGFFAHLLKREFLANVAREKGRFRTFLLNAFQNYLRDRRDHDHAEKRGGGQAPDSLDQTDDDGQAIHDPAFAGVSPDVAYDQAWAKAVLDGAFQRVA